MECNECNGMYGMHYKCNAFITFHYKLMDDSQYKKLSSPARGQQASSVLYRQ